MTVALTFWSEKFGPESATLKKIIIDRIMRRNERSKQEQSIVGDRHIDFSSNNIIAEDGKFFLYKLILDYDSHVYDICALLRGFINLKVNPSSSRLKILALRDAFFAGYDGRVDLSALRFMMAACRFHIEKLLNRLDACRGLGPRAWMSKRLHAQSLHWLLDQ